MEALPIVHEGAEMILLRDPEGVVEQSLVVSRSTAFLLSLMDGTRTIEEVQGAYLSGAGVTLDLAQIREIVEAMDTNLFLMNDNFTRHYKELRDAYESRQVRESFLAGKSYPHQRQELLAFLDEMLTVGDGAAPEREITGILAPHIDYGRGKDVYRAVYRYLKRVETPLLVIFGTSHTYSNGLMDISLKDFATPLGVVPGCAGLCELIRANKTLNKYINEWPHRSEHSIELQLPIIQFMTAGRRIEILPILTGSMHPCITGNMSLEGEEIRAPLEGLRETLAAYGKPYLVIAGADLAHIGAQFGDSYALDRDVLARSREKDEAVLGHVKRVDPAGFFEEIKREGDSRRICGLTSIYLQLSLLKGSACDIVDYGQWTDGRSSVSFAGGVFYTSPRP